MAHNQSHFGVQGQKPPPQKYGSYQQPASTASTGGQYSSQAQPVSDSYSSSTAPVYAPAANYTYSTDYPYSATGYERGNTVTGAVRNKASTDLQQLAYASGLHNANQRSAAQSPVTTSQKSPPAVQSFQNPRAYSNNSNTSFGATLGAQQVRPKSVNSLAGRWQHSTPLEARNLRDPSGLAQSNYTNPIPSPKPATQRSSTALPPSATYAGCHQQVHAVAPTTTIVNSSRRLPTMSQITRASNSAGPYHWSSGQQCQTNVSDTVDPTQVYDPWPEIEHKREAERTAKGLEEKARANRKRLEQEAETRRQLRKEEARKAEEQRQIEERSQIKQRRQAEEQHLAEERRKAEEQRQQEESRQAAAAQQQAAQTVTKVQKSANTKTKMSKAAGAPAPSTTGESWEDDEEAQMRALMEKIRKLNEKNPRLVALVWEEERQRAARFSPAQMAAQSGPAQLPRPQNQPTHQTQRFKQTSTPVFPNPQPISQVQQAPPPTQRLPGPSVSNAQRQPQPEMKPTAGKPVWSAEKLDQISRAASSFLNAVPENANKQVTSEEVCNLFNRKPTYLELCEWLETEGLKFERAIFAKALLTAVPDINQANKVQSPANQRPNGVALRPAIDTSKRPPGGPEISDTHSNVALDRSQIVAGHRQAQQSNYLPPETAQSSSPYFAAKEKATKAQPPLPTPPQIPVARMPHTRHASGTTRQASGSRQGSGSRETSQKPATNAEAARKRDFSEIIDLTALDDEEEENLPPAKKKATSPNNLTPTWALPPSVLNLNQPIPPLPSNAHLAHPIVPMADDRMRDLDVVRPIESKNALRRSTYDVKTIARDVLLATGKHPEMRPLNGHLEILKESFKNVDNSSDLSTLRWDLMDPGEPPANVLKANVIELDDDDADDEDEPAQPAQPKAHPQPTVPSNSTAELRPVTQKEFHPFPPAILSDETQEPSLENPKKRGPGRPPAAHRSRDIPIRSTEDPRANARTTTTQRDRVLEPKSDHPRTAPRPIPIYHSPTMAQGSQSAGALVGYSAFRQQELSPDGTPAPKKKGRPVGWRKAIHSKEAQARAAGLSPAALAVHLKSTAGVASRASSIASHRTSHSVYKCQWEGCTAELHNMDTLRKHVFKFHQAKNQHNKFPCFWESCKENESSLDPRTGKPNGFSIAEDFTDHLEFAHLGPKAWELGDGHAGGLSESQDSGNEAYLYDSKTGRQVTPKIVPRKRNATEGIPRHDSKKSVEEKSVASRDTVVQKPMEDGYIVGFSP